jgi:hypothetical protein
MRPFETLGLRPFLYAEGAELEQLRAVFHKLSRQFHPDRFINASDESRATAEAQAAALNTDYASLRDTGALIDRVLAEAANAEGATREPTRGALPPELAEEYFELQEQWAEDGPASPTAQASAASFLKRIEDKRAQAEQAVLALARRYPFRGFTEIPSEPAPAPWTANELAPLRAAVHELRYYRSFERDIRQKSGIQSSK